MGVALVLCVAQVNASHFFAAVTLRKLASGSAEADALAVPLLHLGLGAALQLALTLAVLTLSAFTDRRDWRAFQEAYADPANVYTLVLLIHRKFRRPCKRKPSISTL